MPFTHEPTRRLSACHRWLAQRVARGADLPTTARGPTQTRSLCPFVGQSCPAVEPSLGVAPQAPDGRIYFGQTVPEPTPMQSASATDCVDTSIKAARTTAKTILRRAAVSSMDPPEQEDR